MAQSVHGRDGERPARFGGHDVCDLELVGCSPHDLLCFLVAFARLPRRLPVEHVGAILWVFRLHAHLTGQGNDDVLVNGETVVPPQLPETFHIVPRPSPRGDPNGHSLVHAHEGNHRVGVEVRLNVRHLLQNDNVRSDASNRLQQPTTNNHQQQQQGWRGCEHTWRMAHDAVLCPSQKTQPKPNSCGTPHMQSKGGEARIVSGDKRQY